ncbi:hypothetical protein [Streptomyces sp. NBC_01320]|nr:hypothetical protein OG395_45245 [Streptomyces sp. NBC_01320]
MTSGRPVDGGREHAVAEAEELAAAMSRAGPRADRVLPRGRFTVPPKDRG